MCLFRASIALICAVSIAPAVTWAAPVSLEEQRRVYEVIAGGTDLHLEHRSASFTKHGVTWTIFGASQPRNDTYAATADWPSVPDRGSVYVVRKPISDAPILPRAAHLAGVTPDGILELVAAPGEYEPASLVLRSGGQSLRDVRVKVSDLAGDDGSAIGAEHVDVRLVKVWYQSGRKVQRRPDDQKQLIPELLLHDGGMVRIDEKHQVNLVRDIKTLQDAEVIQPFDVPPRTNQQLWIIVHVPENGRAGNYIGRVTLSYTVNARARERTVDLELRVLPFKLAETPLRASMYYVGWMRPPFKDRLNANGKTRRQVLHDLIDMHEHGMNNVLVMHDYQARPDGRPGGRPLRPFLQIMRQAGYDTTELFYRDRKLSGIDSRETYRRKIALIYQMAKSEGFRDVYIYNLDEARNRDLFQRPYSFRVVHELGGRNFTTIRGNQAARLRGLLDVAILHRVERVAAVKKAGMQAWAYNDPQGGEETPETYRRVYGFSLWLDGYDGISEYIYQNSRQGWNDWNSDHFRPHNMTYPSVTRPISTLQWEGWREAMDDLRYLSTLLGEVAGIRNIAVVTARGRLLRKVLGVTEIPRDPIVLRRKIVRRLLTVRS